MAGFGLVVKFLLLLGLIRLLLVTDRPYLCAGIYTAVVLLFSILTGYSIGELLLTVIIVGALSTLYFWLLYKLHGMGWIF